MRFSTTAKALALLCPIASCRPLAPAASVDAGTSDTAFAGVQARGGAVMGVDQTLSTHRFMTLPDGGSIELVSNTGASADVAAIRKHLRTITTAFAVGDFTDPSLIHAGVVPGSAEMKRLAREITYAYTDVERGGVVVIQSKNRVAIDAIARFLEFQRTSHRTHDTGHRP